MKDIKKIRADVVRLAGMVGWDARWECVANQPRAENAARLLRKVVSILDRMIAESPTKQCRECLGEFPADELPDGICDECNREPCDACDGTGESGEWDEENGPLDCEECGGDGVI